MNETKSIPSEKRLACRCGLNPGIECRVLDPETGQRWSGLVLDISCFGLSLLLESKIDPGHRLVAEIDNRHKGVPQYVGLTVRHSDFFVSTKNWLLGCSLIQELTAEELYLFKDEQPVGWNVVGDLSL